MEFYSPGLLCGHFVHVIQNFMITIETRKININIRNQYGR
jgi:hypothetical protein